MFKGRPVTVKLVWGCPVDLCPATEVWSNLYVDT